MIFEHQSFFQVRCLVVSIEILRTLKEDHSWDYGLCDGVINEKVVQLSEVGRWTRTVKALRDQSLMGGCVAQDQVGYMTRTTD